MIIDALRGRANVTGEFRRLHAAGVTTYCSVVSWAEVFAGVRPGEEAATGAFFAARADLPIDAHIGERAGRYLARFARSHGVGLGDALIAASASLTGLRLWAVNRRHYPMDDVHFYEPTGSE